MNARSDRRMARSPLWVLGLLTLYGCPGSWVQVFVDRSSAAGPSEFHQLLLSGDIAMKIPEEPTAQPWPVPTAFTISGDRSHFAQVDVRAWNESRGEEVLEGTLAIPWDVCRGTHVQLCLGPIGGGFDDCDSLSQARDLTYDCDDGYDGPSWNGNPSCIQSPPSASLGAQAVGDTECTRQWVHVQVTCGACQPTALSGYRLRGTIELTGESFTEGFSFEQAMTLPTDFRLDIGFRYQGEATLSVIFEKDDGTFLASGTTSWTFGNPGAGDNPTITISLDP